MAKRRPEIVRSHSTRVGAISLRWSLTTTAFVVATSATAQVPVYAALKASFWEHLREKGEHYVRIKGAYDHVVRTASGQNRSSGDGRTLAVDFHTDLRADSPWSLRGSLGRTWLQGHWKENSSSGNLKGHTDDHSLGLAYRAGKWSAELEADSPTTSLNGFSPNLQNVFRIFNGDPHVDLRESERSMGLRIGYQATKFLEIEAAVSRRAIQSSATIVGPPTGTSVELPLGTSGNQWFVGAEWRFRDSKIVARLDRADGSGRGPITREGNRPIGTASARHESWSAGIGMSRLRADDSRNGQSLWVRRSQSSFAAFGRIPDALDIGIDQIAGARALYRFDWSFDAWDSGIKLHRSAPRGASYTYGFQLHRSPIYSQGSYQVAQFLNGVSGRAELDWRDLWLAILSAELRMPSGRGEWELALTQAIPFRERHAGGSGGSGVSRARSNSGGTSLTVAYRFKL